MAQKKVSASELAKAKEAIKKEKRISGSASSKLQSPSSSMLSRNAGGITGKGGKNVNPLYKDSGGHVKVIAAGTKPLTKPDKPYHIGALRSPDQLRRMGGGGGIAGAFGVKNK